MVVALYLPQGAPDAVHANGATLEPADSLESLSGGSYYWDGEHGILYIGLEGPGTAAISLLEGGSTGHPAQNAWRPWRHVHALPLLAALALLAWLAARRRRTA